jgi:hypothetical protein
MHKELRIVFTKSKKKFPIASWAIRLWTGKEYSHVARAVQIRDWGWRFYQASEGKVNYEYEKYFLQKHEIVKDYILLISPEMDRKIKKECYEQAGNRYGTIQNLGIVFVDILHKITGRKVDNPWKKGKNCSELLYENVFSILCSDLNYDPNTVKPHQIEEIILKYFKEVNGKRILK